MMRKTIFLLALFALCLLPWGIAAEETLIDRTGFTAVTTSDWADNLTGQNLMDGNLGTIWHADPNTPLPISITIDMQKPTSVSGIRITFRETDKNGFFQEGKIYAGNDGEHFTQISEFTCSGTNPVETLYFHEEQMRFLRVTVTKATSGHAIAREFEFITGGPEIEKQVYMDEVSPKTFKVYASSTKEGKEIENAFDGDKNTFWHSHYAGVRDKPPYTITINMGRTELISGIVYWPQTEKNRGFFTKTEIYASEDGKEYIHAGTAEWSAEYGRKSFYFEPIYAKYIKLEVKEATINYGAAAEISIAYDEAASKEYKKTHSNRYVLKQGAKELLHIDSKQQQETMPVDNALLYKYDTLYFPLRGLFELFGGSVEWNGDTMTVTAKLMTETYRFQVEDKRFYQNKTRYTLYDSPILHDNRVYVPVTFLEKFLKENIYTYDEASETFYIEEK